MVKHCGGIDSFRKCPVHPVMHHRSSAPVRGIHDTGRAVRNPGITDSTAEKILGHLNIFGSRFLFLRICRKRPLCNQPCPFNAVSGSCPVRLELIIRLLLIAFQIRHPFLCKMLRDPPFIPGSPAYHMINDTARPHTVFFIAGHIRCRQKCLHCMHICIQPAVVIQYGKFGIPGIAGKPFLFIPETKVIQLQRILKQLLRPRPSGKDGGRRRQNHKCMGVALLVGKYLPVGSKPRIPSAVFLIMKLALKPL